MLQGILKGLVIWLYELILSGVEYVSNALLDVFKMDLTYFETNVSVTTEIFSIIVAVGWALLIGNLAFQAMKTMASGIGFEGEDPKILFCRTFVFGFLLLASRQICGIGMAISGSVIELLQVPESVIIPKFELDAFDFESSWIIAVVVGIILIFQIIKFFFEMGERYVILAVLTILAPIAFGVGGSKSTEDLFKGWCRMFASMCLMMIMNVVFLKLLLSAMGTIPSGPAVLPWTIFVVAIGRVARKIDDVISRIGLNTAKTGDPLGRSNLPGMLTMAVAKRIASAGVSRSSSAKASHVGRGMGATAHHSSSATPHFSSSTQNSSAGSAQTGGQANSNTQQTANQHSAQGSTSMVNANQSSAPQTISHLGDMKSQFAGRENSVESRANSVAKEGTSSVSQNRPQSHNTTMNPRQENTSAGKVTPNRPPIGRPAAQNAKSQSDKGTQFMSQQETSLNSNSNSTQNVPITPGRKSATPTGKITPQSDRNLNFVSRQETSLNSNLNSTQNDSTTPGRKSATPTGKSTSQSDRNLNFVSRQETSFNSSSNSALKAPATPGRNNPDLYSRSSGADVPPLQNPTFSSKQKSSGRQNPDVKERTNSTLPHRPPIGTNRDGKGGDRR